MVPALREEFNRNYTPEKYQQVPGGAGQGHTTPTLASASPRRRALFRRLCSTRWRSTAASWFRNWSTIPSICRKSDASLPAQYNVPNESPRPMFVQVDFGLVRNAKGELEPKLVELQAFPSLYGYQPVVGASVHRVLRSARRVWAFISRGLNRDSYWKLMRELIVGASRSRERHPDGDRSRAPENAAGFSGHAARAWHRHRRYLVAEEARQEALLHQGRARDRSPPHLQPLHRRRTGAQGHHAASSICATNSMSNGPAIPTGTSASASSPFPT